MRLITIVDDFGRYEADPELLRSELFPYGDPDGTQIDVRAFARALRTFADTNIIEVYQSGEGKTYLQVTRWKERIRSESRFPDPKKCKMLTSADICPQMQASPPYCLTALLPTPPPTPARAREQRSPSDAGEHSPRRKADGGELESANQAINGGIEVPLAFPKDLDEAFARTASLAVPLDFVSKTWDKAMSRAGHDAKGQAIRSWTHYVKAEWGYEQARNHERKTTIKSGRPGASDAGTHETKTDYAAAAAKRKPKPLAESVDQAQNRPQSAAAGA